VTTPPAQQTPAQNIGAGLFGLSIVICSMEMVPGWGLLHLGWSPGVFMGIMAACGAVSGLLMAAKHPVPGLLGGLVAGPGALFAIGFVLERTTRTQSLILVIVGLVGALPGVGLYAALAALQNALTRQWTEPQRDDDEEDADEGYEASE
jgi:hypothetical protein